MVVRPSTSRRPRRRGRLPLSPWHAPYSRRSTITRTHTGPSRCTTPRWSRSISCVPRYRSATAARLISGAATGCFWPSSTGSETCRRGDGSCTEPTTRPLCWPTPAAGPTRRAVQPRGGCPLPGRHLRHRHRQPVDRARLRSGSSAPGSPGASSALVVTSFSPLPICRRGTTAHCSRSESGLSSTRPRRNRAYVGASPAADPVEAEPGPGGTCARIQSAGAPRSSRQRGVPTRRAARSQIRADSRRPYGSPVYPVPVAGLESGRPPRRRA